MGTQIYTTHPDNGAPMTLDRLRRAYITHSDAFGEHVVRLRKADTHHDGPGDDDDWEWTFAAFKLRVEAALT